MFLEFVEGPLWYAAVVIFLGGVAIRLGIGQDQVLAHAGEAARSRGDGEDDKNSGQATGKGHCSHFRRNAVLLRMDYIYMFPHCSRMTRRVNALRRGGRRVRWHPPQVLLFPIIPFENELATFISRGTFEMGEEC